MSSPNTTKPLPSDAVWLVTGCSSGIGQSLVQTILRNGQRVVATARNPSALSYLPDDDPSVLKLSLDVTSNESVTAAFKAAVDRFGKIDVVVNNAGYSYYGDFEACAAPENESEARREMETNFWGVVNCTREALRVFRENKDKGGVVIQVSSMGGMVGYPGNSFYHASKFAIEGLTESIAKEMPEDWNIQFLILEPGGVKTEYAKGSMMVLPPHPAYTDDRMPTRMLQKYMRNNDMVENWAEANDVTGLLFNVVKSKGEKKMPFRLLMGRDAYDMVLQDLTAVVNEYKDWEGVSTQTGKTFKEQNIQADTDFMNRK